MIGELSSATSEEGILLSHHCIVPSLDAHHVLKVPLSHLPQNTNAVKKMSQKHHQRVKSANPNTINMQLTALELKRGRSLVATSVPS